MVKKNIQLKLTNTERQLLRKCKVTKGELTDYSPDELEVMLDITPSRAKELFALADFQQIPTIGVEFAIDLIYLGFYTISELQNQDGATLINRYEKKKGYRVDPCVEDQFRLVVDFANHHDNTKRWWDFTQIRKDYRVKFGYPDDRPSLSYIDTK